MESKELLKHFSLKVTPIRLEVLAILGRAKAPMSIPELHKRLAKSGANYVTVYRTMQSFKNAGLVRSVNLRHGHTDYELVSENDHHHVVCTGCGKIEEFEVCNIESLAKNILKKTPSFRSINDHALELFGVCTTCAR